jgi:hypothetical protein
LGSMKKFPILNMQIIFLARSLFFNCSKKVSG